MSRNLENYQEEYARQPYERYQVAFRKRKILELLATTPHDSLLEVGCGLESIFLNLETFLKITVIEPAAVFYQKALADKEARPDLDIRILDKTLEDASEVLGDEKFDFILVSSLLHELPDPEGFLKILSTLCGPETVVHINVPNAFSFHRLLALEAGLVSSPFELSGSNYQFQQNSVFSLGSLGDLVTRAGFSILESGSYSPKPFTHVQMQALLDQKILDEKILDGLYRMGKYLPGLGSEVFVHARLTLEKFAER